VRCSPSSRTTTTSCLQIGHWAETIAGRLFPVMSFVVLGFGIGTTQNLVFLIVFDMVAKPFS
jgi:hypothetical protein